MADRSIKPRRRWRLAVTVRLLMVVVFVLSLLLGWRVNRAHTQREVVAAIRQSGGGVRYDYEFNGDEFLVDAKPWAPAWLRRLIGDEYFQEVVEAHLGGLEVKQAGPQARATALIALKRLDRLRRIWLYSYGFADAELAHLKPLDRLQSLSLRHCDTFTEESLAFLEGFHQLRELDLQGTPVRDAGLVHLRGLDQLEELDLSHTAITDAGLANLESFSRLRKLDLGINYDRAQVGDAGVARLSGLNQLEELSLSGTKVGDAGVARLAGLHRLKRLDLYATKVGDAGLVGLSQLRELRELDLSHAPISDAGLAHLTGLEHLEKLVLEDTAISDVGLVHLKGLCRLKRLDLAATRISDAGLVQLRGLRQLEYLNLEVSQVTRSGALGLGKALKTTYIKSL
jgi:hypothetical protein